MVVLVAFRPAPDVDGPRVTEKQPEHTPLMKQNGCSGIICKHALMQQAFTVVQRSEKNDIATASQQL